MRGDTSGILRLDFSGLRGCNDVPRRPFRERATGANLVADNNDRADNDNDTDERARARNDGADNGADNSRNHRADDCADDRRNNVRDNEANDCARHAAANANPGADCRTYESAAELAADLEPITNRTADVVRVQCLSGQRLDI